MKVLLPKYYLLPYKHCQIQSSWKHQRCISLGKHSSMSSIVPVLFVLVVVLVLIACAGVFVPKGPQQV